MTISVPKGVFDIYEEPKDAWKDARLWRFVEAEMRKVARLYALTEIRTPVFERTELFQKGVGETTDIVSKEMYVFEDKAGRSMSLRPEGTAPVIRAYLEHGFPQKPGLHKFFYIAPMFRYERQQAGRYRQHHQFGAEVIGDISPERDAELIDLLMTLFHNLGLSHLSLEVNSIGDYDCRRNYRQALIDFLSPQKDQLSGDSQLRLQANPLRILDSKDPRDKEILRGAPSILEFLEPEASDHFSAVQRSLEELKIPYTINPGLVRGLDYYNRTVFEITAGELGAQNAIAGGGRYDGLIGDLGGPATPALGFGSGIERIIQTLLAQEAAPPLPPRTSVLLVPLGDRGRARCVALTKELRTANIPSEIDLSGKKLKNALRMADQIGARFVAVIGDQEVETGVCELKEMQTRTSEQVRLEQLASYLNG